MTEEIDDIADQCGRRANVGTTRHRRRYPKITGVLFGPQTKARKIKRLTALAATNAAKKLRKEKK
jgi:hypothetical protein